MNIEQAINQLIQAEGIDRGKISDGYHSFEELYEHRHALFIALCNILNEEDYPESKRFPWKSRKHSDGTKYGDWFIAGMSILEGHQITYHLPDELWDLLRIEEREQAPDWDGHTSRDVIDRLLTL